jgi:hypothetical protein
VSNQYNEKKKEIKKKICKRKEKIWVYKNKIKWTSWFSKVH